MATVSGAMGNLRVGFIGAGKMAAALARGFAETLPCGSKMISASCPPADARLLDDIRNMGCTTMHSNRDLVANNDVILMAVKPSVMPVICKEVQGLINSSKLVVSIAAGVKLQSIQQLLSKDAKVAKISFTLFFLFI